LTFSYPASSIASARRGVSLNSLIVAALEKEMRRAA